MKLAEILKTGVCSAVVSAVALLSVAAPPAGNDAYPVLCWTYYAFTNRMDDARTVADWKDLGINRPLSPRVDGNTDKAAFRAFLDRCLAAGIRPYVYDTRIADIGNIRKLIREKNDGGAAYRALVREVVADWGGHPAVSGFYVGDEPDAPDASATFLAARIQREEAPRLEPLLNLLPWFSWIGPRVGAKSLGEYLDRCRRESGLDFLGYDCYAQQKYGRAAKDIDDYFVNLREWAEFGKRSGVRWNTTLLCTPHYGYTIESEDDFRWQISTAAAMGAKGLSWFYPDMHMGPHDNYRNAPINALGERSETFGWLSTEMRLFQRQFGAALMDLRWESAYCAGRTCGGLSALESVTNGLVRAVSSRDGVLVSFFKDAQGTPYVALVALARTVSDGLHVTFAPDAEPETLAWRGWKKLSTVFDPLDREKRGPHTIFLHASPGQLFLMRLKTDVPTLAEGFANPPAAARPRVWWHWMNGNVSKAGITADLEAMAKAGIGGAHLFDVGCGIPPGDVKFNTPSWDEHVDWAAREAERLGLELTLVNCSGFANAGGPWIAPSNSMFFVRHTETAVNGGATFRGVLPRAKDDHGFYRDIAVLAFPRPACERAPSGGLRVSSPAPWVRVVTADEPFALGGFTFSATYGWGWNVTAKVRVEVSDDGQSWRETEMVDVWLSSNGRSDCINGDERYVAFTHPSRARQVRITMEPEDKTFIYTSFRPELRRGLPDLNARTFRSYDNFAPCTHEVGADGVVDPKTIVNLTDRLGADGTLEWTAPAGADWIVLRVGYASNGAVVHPASSFGGGLEVDKLDAAAVGFHFDSYAGRLAKGHKSVKSVLCDSYEVGTQNWTHGLEKTFAQRKGYSLVPYLVAFSGRIVGSVKRTDEALWDFRRLISDLFVENFVDECARKARAAGLRYAMEPYGNMSADATHYAAHVDLPMSEFWVTADDGVPTDHVGHSAITKCVSSAAHLHGRDGVDAEAFTAFPLKGGRWLKDPFGLKAMGDFYYTLGVTRMVYHRFAHQPWTEPARLPGMTMGQWGTHFERTETWWPMVGPWVAYQSRCQYLLAAGHPANDLVVYVGDEVPNSGTPEVVPADTWDVCGMHDLEELSVVGGNIVPKNAPGVSYVALVVPTNRLITAASRAHLARLRSAGARLLKSGEELPFAPAFTYSGTNEKLRWICRRHDDGTRVFFVAYPSTNAAVVRCSFRTVNAVPQLWDAESGERFRPYDWKPCGDHIEVTLPFKPCGSWFVVFSPKDDGAALPVLEDPAKRVPRLTEEVGGDWELSFPRGWNCPDKVTLPKLVSWTEIPDGEVRYFSGIATYAKTVALPQGFADGKGRVVLDLGQVKNVAEVTVNGRTYPPLWRPPFRVDVTDAVRAGEPMRLAVRVANLWPNRLIGDEQKPADCEWGYKWDKLAIKEIPEWVKSGKPSPSGRLAFTTWHHWTKDDALVESGLVGPVSLQVK